MTEAIYKEWGRKSMVKIFGDGGLAGWMTRGFKKRDLVCLSNYRIAIVQVLLLQGTPTRYKYDKWLQWSLVQ